MSLAIELHVNPSLADGRARRAAQISELRQQGWTWAEIGKFFNVHLATARTIAKEYGLFVQVNAMKRFTKADRDYICDAWARGEHTKIIAEKLERSDGVIRQEVLKLQRAGRIGTRNRTRTHIIHRYGHAALNAGATPTEALQAINKAKADAFNFAGQTAREAASKRRTLAIKAMLAKIEAGQDRNGAIFEARCSGATLQEIADNFDLTRERIRQICFKHAEHIALARVFA